MFGAVPLLPQCCCICVILGFLWVHHLQVVHVLQRVQRCLVVLPLPSPHVPLWDPVSGTGCLMGASGHMTTMPAPPGGALDQVIVSHLLSRLPSNSRWSRLTRLPLWSDFWSS